MLTKEDRARMLLRAADKADAKTLAADVRRLLEELEAAEVEITVANARLRQWRDRESDRCPDI